MFVPEYMRRTYAGTIYPDIHQVVLLVGSWTICAQVERREMKPAAYILPVDVNYQGNAL